VKRVSAFSAPPQITPSALSCRAGSIHTLIDLVLYDAHAEIGFDVFLPDKCLCSAMARRASVSLRRGSRITLCAFSRSTSVSRSRSTTPSSHLSESIRPNGLRWLAGGFPGLFGTNSMGRSHISFSRRAVSPQRPAARPRSRLHPRLARWQLPNHCFPHVRLTQTLLRGNWLGQRTQPPGTRSPV